MRPPYLPISQIAAVQRDWPSLLAGPSQAGAGTPPITYPTTPLVIKVELLLGDTWVNVVGGTNGILYEPRIRIERGRKPESRTAGPSSCRITLKNPDQVWSPRNTASPYYGKLNRNVQLRVTVNPGDKDYVRFTGYVSQWPQQWTTGQHRWVTIEANGILRRIQQGKSPLKAPIYRAMIAQNPYAYWTLTDVTGTANCASSVSGGTPSELLGAGGDIGGISDTPDGQPAFVVNTGGLRGTVTPTKVGASDGWIIGFGMKSTKVPLAMQPFVESAITFYLDGTDLGRIEMVLPEGDLGGFPTEFDFFNSSGTIVSSLVGDPFIDPSDYDDEWKYYQILAVRSGLTLNLFAYYEGGQVSINSIALSSATAGNVTSYQINPKLVDHTNLHTSFSNISVLARNTINNDSSAFQGYPGEAPTNRFARLCTEEGLPYVVSEADPDGEGMGAQQVKTLIDLLRECEAVNEGIIDETLDGKIRLISRTVLWNQPPSMTIDYNSGVIKPGFLPTDDDLIVRNDWTITRTGGNSRQYQENIGPLSINDPTALTNPGVGKYDDSATLSLSTDDAAYQHATFRVFRGTVNEIRISAMPLHFTADPGLLPYWLAMDMVETSRFLITNTPKEMGSIPADQIMTGYSEVIDQLEWTAVPSSIPASTEKLGVLDFYGWTDCGASYLAEDLDATETDVDLQINDICFWYHDEGNYNVMIRGEEVTVTAVSVPVGSGSSWTQTLTVIRSVNGVVLAHPLSAGLIQVMVSEPFIPIL